MLEVDLKKPWSRVCDWRVEPATFSCASRARLLFVDRWGRLTARSLVDGVPTGRGVPVGDVWRWLFRGSGADSYCGRVEHGCADGDFGSDDYSVALA